MTCGLCGRFTKAGPLPPGWKVHGSVIFCRDCRRQQFRLRVITMTVAEPIRAQWQEFRRALEEMWSRATPVQLADQAWELTTSKGQHIVRVLIGNQWWALRVQDRKWSPGRREAYEKIAAGEAAAEEFCLYPKPARKGRIPKRASRDVRPYEVECKTVAWLARQQPEPLTTLHARVRRLEGRMRDQNIGEIDLGDLRRAIRANWISFPSQVPTFPSCGPADLQHKLIQLYFLMGWSCANIAARYGLTRGQVRAILHAWKGRAASTGYLQHIAPAEALRGMEMLLSSLQKESITETPNPSGLPLRRAPGSRPGRGLRTRGLS